MLRTHEEDVLKKPVDMIVMRPKKGKITLIGRRLYTVLLAYAQREIGGNDTGQRYLFQAPLAGILNSGSFTGGEVTLMKKYIKEMVTTAIEWDTTATDGSPIWDIMPMLARGRIEKRGELNWVCWEFNSLVVDMLVDPAMYARLNLKIATNIESYVGTALYEICARYRNNPSGVTSKKSTDWWIDSLSQTAAEPGKRREWRKFKDEKLLKAIDDINDTTDLKIELFEEKVGRAIAFVQFAVTKKSTELLREVRAVNLALTQEIEKLSESLEIDMPRVETLIKKFGEVAVMENLKLLKARIHDTSLPPVERKVGYLRFLLEENAMDLLESKKNAPVIDTAKITTVSVKEASNSLEKRESGDTVQRQGSVGTKVEMGGIVEVTSPSLRTKIRDEFNVLPELQRKEIIETVANQLKNENRFGALELKNSHLTYIRPGLFGSAVIEYYGKKVHGDAWTAPVADF